MGIRLAHDVLSAHFVEFIRLETEDHARLHSQTLAHKRHRSGEVLAVSPFQIIKECHDRIAPLNPLGVGQIERIREVFAEVLFDIGCDLAIEWIDVSRQ